MNLSKPDIINSLLKEGIKLRQCGVNYKAFCPFHSEKTPSFMVNHKKQVAHCFGCGWHGDVLQFVMDYKKISFKEALRYLGISQDKPYKPNYREIKKRELIKKFKSWCDSYYNLCCEFYRLWNDVKAGIKTLGEAERYAEFYHREPVITYQMDILFDRDDAAKLELYREVVYAN